MVWDLSLNLLAVRQEVTTSPLNLLVNFKCRLFLFYWTNCFLKLRNFLLIDTLYISVDRALNTDSKQQGFTAWSFGLGFTELHTFFIFHLRFFLFKLLYSRLIPLV